MLASGSWDDTIRLHRVKDGKLLWILISGSKGNWLSINPNNRLWRGDDGSLLVNKDENGNVTPVLPPKPVNKGYLNIRVDNQISIQAFDGRATPIIFKIKNIGAGRVYWINIIQDMDRAQKTPLVFHPPPTSVNLEPGDEIEMTCKVSALSQYTNPFGIVSTLYLKITTAYGDPIPIEIPVNIHVPTIQLLQAKLQKQDKTVLLVLLQNVGDQDILTETEFTGKIGDYELNKVTKKTINKLEKFDLSFTIPGALEIEKNSKLNLIARKSAYPVHVWEFNDIPISFPLPAWFWFVLFNLLLLVSTIGIYYLRIYLHPLTKILSKTPSAILNLAPQELLRARNLLKLSRRLETVLSSSSIYKSHFENSILFYRNWGLNKRCQYLVERLEATCESVIQDHIHLYKFKMCREFMLNMDQCLLAFPPGDMPANEVLNHIKKIEGAFYQICLFITFNEQQQAELRKTSLNLDNLFVTPHDKELTHLLLSPSPLDVFA
jgi:hypothetical protein